MKDEGGAPQHPVFNVLMRRDHFTHHPSLITRHSARRAFTLVEVMLAVLILGLGLGVLMAAAGKAVRVAAKAKDYETARRLIYQLELEHPLQLDDLREDEERGSFGFDYPGYRWSREVEEYGEEADRLFKVTTRITWSTARGELFEEVQSLLHEPSALRAGYISDTAANELF